MNIFKVLILLFLLENLSIVYFQIHMNRFKILITHSKINPQNFNSLIEI